MSVPVAENNVPKVEDNVPEATQRPGGEIDKHIVVFPSKKTKKVIR